MAYPIITTLSSENTLVNSLEKTEASVAHTAQNIVTDTADNYDEDYSSEEVTHYFNSIPVHSNFNNNSTNGNLHMASNDDMNLTTNMLKLVTSANAYKATVTALKTVSDTQNDVINQLIGTNEG